MPGILGCGIQPEIRAPVADRQPETPVEQALLENRIGRFAICEQKADCFEYWIAGLYRGGAVPEGLKLYRFPESDWAVFSCKGPAPRLAAGAQHLRLADLVSGRGAAGRGERGRRAGGLFRGRYAEPRLRMRHLGADRAAAADCGRQRRNGSGRRAAGAFISDGAVGSVAGVPAVRHAFYQGRQGLYVADPGPLPAGPAGRDQLYV